MQQATRAEDESQELLEVQMRLQFERDAADAAAFAARRQLAEGVQAAQRLQIAQKLSAR